MEYTLEQRCEKIIQECQKQTSTNPVKIFEYIVSCDFVRMHGPEHHVLDGACLLTAIYNASGKFDLKAGLEFIFEQGLKMPGATCGMWGVCGAVTSCGAALSFLDKTGPLSSDESWGKHMQFTSLALEKIGKIGGPRCCKRDGFTALSVAVEFINKNYPFSLETSPVICNFHEQNAQCIKHTCPYFI